MENYKITIEEQTFVVKDETEKNNVTILTAKGDK